MVAVIQIREIINARMEAVLRIKKKQKHIAYNSLNIFEMVSDIYHRENMHSDVLREIFMVGEEQNSRPYLDLFIKYMVEKSKNNISLDIDILLPKISSI